MKRLTIPQSEREDYAKLATAEAVRLDALADEAAYYGFAADAFDLRLEASAMRDLAAQARV